MSLQKRLLELVDEDTRAFNRIMAAFGLPKSSEEEKIRAEAIRSATKEAIEVPFSVMQICLESMEVMHKMAEIGNPNSVTDAAVGALCARTGVEGAFLNVRVNCKDFDDASYVVQITEKGEKILGEAKKMEAEILSICDAKL